MRSYIDRGTEDASIKELQEGITTVLQLTSDAVASYRAYLFDGLGLVNTRIAQINGAALQVFIIIQFCKLFETDYSNEKGEASLYKLNNVLTSKYPEWVGIFDKNGKILKGITKTPTFARIKLLRNKSYGHSEKHPENPALLFKYFSRREFEEFFVLFKSAIEVFTNCFEIYDITYQDYSRYYSNTQQLKFLKRYNKYKKFYLDKLGLIRDSKAE